MNFWQMVGVKNCKFENSYKNYKFLEDSKFHQIFQCFSDFFEISLKSTQIFDWEFKNF